MSSCFVTQIDLALAPKIQAHLQERGLTFSQPAHTLFQAKGKGLTCTLYTSGKLMVQGKEHEDFVRYFLEPEILGTFTQDYAEQDLTPHIGVDESGKGDFFGPLCIAGVYAGGKEIEALKTQGVKDSKRLKDPAILTLAKKIRQTCPYHIVRIGPAKYNELHEKFGNLNLLLGWGHATVIEQMIGKTGCHHVTIDQFAAEHVVETALKRKKMQALLTQRTKGEEDLVVAAASILARAAFVEGLQALEKEVGIALPKGASAAVVSAGKRLVKEQGEASLAKVGKLHFKTREAIISCAS